MAVIKKKNFLNLGPAQRQRWWDDIRDKPEIKARLTAGTLLNLIPGVGKEIGGIVGAFLKFSVGVEGMVEFLIGDDPGAKTV